MVGDHLGVSVGLLVSMESGLEGRNNVIPEQRLTGRHRVSMESGLESRNNKRSSRGCVPPSDCLNGVRPRRPEQSWGYSGRRSWEVESQWSPA